jgi:hypothetical protein
MKLDLDKLIAETKPKAVNDANVLAVLLGMRGEDFVSWDELTDGHGGPPLGWSLEPRSRERLDHYVGRWYQPGPDDDPEGWDSEGWEEEYAGPMRRRIQAALDHAFGPGVLSVDIGEKGHVYVYKVKR